MRKIYVVLLMCCCLLGANAQQMLEEVVYTKNGSVVRGIITEMRPDESLKIETADGNVFVFAMRDVEKITKEPIWGPPRRGHHPHPQCAMRAASYDVRGYRGFIEAGVAAGVGDYGLARLEVNTSHGYQFNPYLFMGGGLGMHFYFDASDALIPIFADCRVNVLPGRISPYIDFKLGYSVGVSDGLYGVGLFLAPGLGARFELANGAQAIRAGLGFSMQQGTVLHYGYYGFGGHVMSNSILFKVGYEF